MLLGGIDAAGVKVSCELTTSSIWSELHLGYKWEMNIGKLLDTFVRDMHCESWLSTKASSLRGQVHDRIADIPIFSYVANTEISVLDYDVKLTRPSLTSQQKAAVNDG